MPTQMEELVGFIGHPNPSFRLAALENLVPFSTSDPALFKSDSLLPVRNLKVLLRDQPIVARHAIHMLVNLSADPVVRENLVADNVFLGLVFARMARRNEPNADMLAMMLANLAKSDKLHGVLLEKRPVADKNPQQEKTPEEQEMLLHETVIDQLLDLFVKGADNKYNKDADFDHLAYLFADLTQHAAVRQHLVSPPPPPSPSPLQPSSTAQPITKPTSSGSADRPIPLSKIKVFTSHESEIRRRGVASAIKNAAFEVSSHPSFLASALDHADGDAAVVDILPYVLLPLMGSETYEEDDMLEMLPEVQMLPPDKTREPHADIIKAHLETLLLLATTREGRDRMREVKVYPIVRELHLSSDDAEVQEAADRLVQMLKRDEEGEEKEDIQAVLGQKAAELEDEDEDNMLVEV